MATAMIPPVPPLPPELLPLARWLEVLRDQENSESSVAGSSDYINVKSSPYNAVGNGVADDTAAIQAALTYAGTIGGTVFIPSGTYKCLGPLVMNIGVSWSHHGPRTRLLGAGSSNTRLLCPTSSVQFLTVGGFGAQYYVDIEGIYFQGPGTVDEVGHPAVDGYGTGTALTLQASSWSSVKDCVVAGWGTGVYVTDSFLCMFSNTYVQTNLNGVYLTGTIYANPNGISFHGGAVNGNKNYAIYAILAVNLAMYSCGVEQNGVGGSGAFTGGIYVSQGPDGASSVSLNAVYFEGNAGNADVLIDGVSNSGANAIVGCTFNRIDVANYVTNNILATVGAGKTLRLSVQGCGFAGFNTYVVSAARPYINTAGVDVQVSWAGCYFQSATETPTISNYIAGGTGAANLARLINSGTGGSVVVPNWANAPAGLGTMSWVELTTDNVVLAGYTGGWIPVWLV